MRFLVARSHFGILDQTRRITAVKRFRYGYIPFETEISPLNHVDSYIRGVKRASIRHSQPNQDVALTIQLADDLTNTLDIFERIRLFHTGPLHAEYKVADRQLFGILRYCVFRFRDVSHHKTLGT